MNCRHARRRVSDYADGLLAGRKASRLERHMASCVACRALLEDFRNISGRARELETPPAPDWAWGRILIKLKTGESPVYKRTPFLRRFAPAFAAAVVVVAGIFLVLQWKPWTAGAGGHRSERYTLAKLDEAERHYEQAVKSLSDAVEGRKGRLEPRFVEMFEGNLRAVDAAIKACHLAEGSAPDDIRVRDFLLAAYQEKVALLDDYLKRERKI
jgi:hypothetical protein